MFVPSHLLLTTALLALAAAPLALRAQSAETSTAPAAPTVKAEDKTKAADPLHGAANKDTKWSRVTVQPNGWGATPEAAIKDLDRVMRIYEEQPGFRRDRYVAVVQVGRDKYQADGRCSYLVPKKLQAKRKKPKNDNVTSGGFARKSGATNASKH